MDSLLNRYRNITVLLLVVAGQLILLAVQVKDDRDIPFIRVWTVTAVTPFARMVEGVRGGGAGFFRDYIRLHDADAENRQLRAEVGKLKMDNIFLRNELNQADRVKALQMFQAETQSKTLAARVFGVGAAASAKMILVDRGSKSGVQRGMAVVTPDGIVGKVIAAYPTASQVLLITDPDFAAGVVSQKNQTHGDLKGTGKDYCIVDYVPMADKVDVGEWFYTSGDDRIFPRGFPAGVVKEVRDAQPFKQILIEPAVHGSGLEDVLIVLSGVHQEIPKTPPSNQPVYIAPAPPPSTAPPPESGASGATGSTAATGAAAATGTEADRLRARYKAIGDAQNHTFGVGLPGSKPPNFNLGVPGLTGSTGAKGPAPSSGAKGATSGTGARPIPADTPVPAGAKGAAASTGAKGATSPIGVNGAPSGTGVRPIPADTPTPARTKGATSPTGTKGALPSTGVRPILSETPEPLGAKGATSPTGTKAALPSTGVRSIISEAPGPSGAKGATSATGARPLPADTPAPVGVKGPTASTGASTGTKGAPSSTGAKAIPDGGPDGGRAARMRNAALGMDTAPASGTKAAPAITGATAPTGGPPR